MAHDYFGIDAHEVFRTCTEDIPMLIGTLHKMRTDLDEGPGK